MKQFFSAFVCAFVMFAAGVTPVVAQTAATAPLACPSGSTLVDAYTKKNGTQVAAHCKTSKKKAHGDAMAAPAAMASPAAMSTLAPVRSGSSMSTDSAKTTSCPPGKTYVNGYTTKKGKHVDGYCRRAHAKSK